MYEWALFGALLLLLGLMINAVVQYDKYRVLDKKYKELTHRD